MSIHQESSIAHILEVGDCSNGSHTGSYFRLSSWYAEALYGKEARANRASESGRLWKNINTSPISVPGTMSFGWYILASSQGSFRGLPWSPYSDLGFYIPL